MIFLIQRSKLILTDSGGIQEEAPYFGVPVLILRQTTERIEGVKEKVAFLTGINENKIIFYFRKILENKIKIHTKKNIYGNGNASNLIYKITAKIFENKHNFK